MPLTEQIVMIGLFAVVFASGFFCGHSWTWNGLFRRVITPLKARAKEAESLLLREKAWGTHFKAAADAAQRRENVLAKKLEAKQCELGLLLKLGDGYYSAVYGDGMERPLGLDSDFRAMRRIAYWRDGMKLENRKN